MTLSAHAIPVQLLRDGSTMEIAQAILKGAREDRTVNANNLMAETHEAWATLPDAKELRGRLSDGWAWLEAHGFIGPHPEHSSGETWKWITSEALDVVRAGSLASTQAQERLSGALHPDLHQSAVPNFNRGDYEIAAFAAMKAVEVAVREQSGLADSILGVKLMRRAFGTDGPLTDGDADPGEQVALMELFAGAIGAFKNPASHRTVRFDDPIEAAEVVQLADLLLRVLDRVERRRRFEE